jgi:ADP-heptose:LPS heptosyltransferase
MLLLDTGSLPFMKVLEYESLSGKVRLFLKVVDELGSLVTWPFKSMHARTLPTPDSVKKVLLLRCDGIGDVVFSTPAIAAVRKRYPNAQLDLVVGPWCRDVAAMVPGIDNLLLHAPWGYRKLRAVQENISLAEDFRFARRIRQERYDICVDLRGDLLSIVPMSLWKIPIRIARATRGGEFALTHVIPPVTASRKHEIERTLDVAAVLGSTPSNQQTPQLRVPLPMQEAAKELFARRGIDLSTSILLLPGAQWVWRQWLPQNFHDLGRLLLARGYPVVVVGAKTDEAMLNAIVQDTPYMVKMAGDLNLQQLAGALAHCRAFIAAESGPAAIASGVGARGVVLFGPGIPEQFGPRAKNIRIIYEPCGDQPCYQRGDCQRKENWCMGRITVDRVLSTLEQVLTQVD